MEFEKDVKICPTCREVIPTNGILKDERGEPIRDEKGNYRVIKAPPLDL